MFFSTTNVFQSSTWYVSNCWCFIWMFYIFCLLLKVVWWPFVLISKRSSLSNNLFRYNSHCHHCQISSTDGCLIGNHATTLFSYWNPIWENLTSTCYGEIYDNTVFLCFEQCQWTCLVHLNLFEYTSLTCLHSRYLYDSLNWAFLTNLSYYIDTINWHLHPFLFLCTNDNRIHGHLNSNHLHFALFSEIWMITETMKTEWLLKFFFIDIN